MKGVTALLCGALFGFGLAMSGMTDTAKVRGFLDLFGDWIPDLAFVMGGAVLVTIIAFRFVLARERPLLAPKFNLPTNRNIDGPLLLGAIIFGVGWGIYGYCPGPAISALVYLDGKIGIFVVAMLLGMFLASRVGKA